MSTPAQAHATDERGCNGIEYQPVTSFPMSHDETKTSQRSKPRTSGRVPTVRVLFTPVGIAMSPARALRMGGLSLGRVTEEPELLSLRGDASMSRSHANVERLGTNKIVVSDGGSRNGTFINRTRITGPTTLVDGDLIRVGGSLVLYRDEPGDIDDFPIAALSGRAPAIRALRHRVSLVAPTAASVLVLGESGVGKSLVARVIHERSQRRGPFVSVNCAAIPENLAESQLFGHVVGAFTGAQKAHEGFFRAAREGTLFLDEIAELPLVVQAKLLGVLEDRAVTAVGSVDPVKVDVRVVAATNADLDTAIVDRRFRGDLFARLNEVSIEVPPLRARREDVLPLFMHALGEPALRLSCDLAEALVLHPWQFNVRELTKIALDLRIRASAHPEQEIELAMLEDRLAVEDSDDADEAAKDETPAPAQRMPAPTRDQLAKLIEEKHGVISEVALAVGRSRKQVYRWIEQHGLTTVRSKG